MKGNYGNKRFLAKHLVFNQERMRMEERLSREGLEACNAKPESSLGYSGGKTDCHRGRIGQKLVEFYTTVLVID